MICLIEREKLLKKDHQIRAGIKFASFDNWLVILSMKIFDTGRLMIVNEIAGSVQKREELLLLNVAVKLVSLIVSLSVSTHIMKSFCCMQRLLSFNQGTLRGDKLDLFLKQDT